MMKHAVTALSLFLVLSPSQAKTTAQDQVLVSQKPFVSVNQTQMKNVAVRAIPRIKKPKLLRSNPHRLSAIRFSGLDPLAAIDDEDIIFDRRTQIKLEPVTDQDISDHAKTRLLIARVRALEKYREKWA